MRRQWRFLATLLLLGMAWLVGSVAFAESGSGPSTSPEVGYEMSWYTVDGGGITYSTGGSFALGATMGQADAGFMSGGNYVLSGGFWGGTREVAMHSVYLPLVLRSR